MKTRGKINTKNAGEATEFAKSAAPKVQLRPDSSRPPQIFILPQGVSKDARIVTLQNPKDQSDSRYLVCPVKGFYEFSRIAAPQITPRSWLLSSPLSEDDGEPLYTTRNTIGPNFEGYVTKDANLLIATAIDPLFIVLPALCSSAGPKALNTKKLFLSGEDYFNKMTSASPCLASFIHIESTRLLIESRMATVCETLVVENDNMYRLNEPKLLKEILRKARKMVQNGLPLSMEEKLIRRALEQPTIISIPQEESIMQDGDGVLAPGVQTPETETTISTSNSSFSEASTAATSFSETMKVPSKPNVLPPIDAPEGVAELLRLRTAFLYICSAYVNPHVTRDLKTLLATSSDVDFAPLEEHLTYLITQRQEALAARSLGDFSRKRAHDDDENDEKRAEKRRKEEEDKKKRANESRGVKALKKVNVVGMKKMSDFFKKK